MARSLSSIMDQISRLQKEAAAIQNEVVDRIRKEIAKYGLTADQLFGGASVRRASKAKGSAKAARPDKFSDGAGNTWHGMGKRPDWLRQALEAGKALEDFLIGKSAKPATKKASRKKAVAKSAATKKTVAAAKKPAAAKKSQAAKKTVSRKPRAKPAQPKAEG